MSWGMAASGLRKSRVAIVMAYVVVAYVVVAYVVVAYVGMAYAAMACTLQVTSTVERTGKCVDIGIALGIDLSITSMLQTVHGIMYIGRRVNELCPYIRGRPGGHVCQHVNRQAYRHAYRHV